MYIYGTLLRTFSKMTPSVEVWLYMDKEISSKHDLKKYLLLLALSFLSLFNWNWQLVWAVSVRGTITGPEVFDRSDKAKGCTHPRAVIKSQPKGEGASLGGVWPIKDRGVSNGSYSDMIDVLNFHYYGNKIIYNFKIVDLFCQSVIWT